MALGWGFGGFGGFGDAYPDLAELLKRVPEGGWPSVSPEGSDSNLSSSGAFQHPNKDEGVYPYLGRKWVISKRVPC